MLGLQEWLVTLRPGVSMGNEPAALQALLLTVPGLQLVRLQLTATGPVAIIRATTETVAQLDLSYPGSFVIAPNTTLSMS